MVNFPNSPTDGQEFTAEGVTWQWDAAGGVWIIISGVGEGFLPLAGGTIAGDLNVVGSATAIGPFTAQVGAVFESGLTSLDDVQVEDGDVLLQGGGLRYTNLTNTTALGQILAAGGFIEFRHGAAGTRIAHYDGARWYMDLDMDVTGNVDIAGSLTVGGVAVPKITEFHDPTGVGSWRIIGDSLEMWGTTASGLSAGVLNFPKRFKDGTVPTFTCAVAATTPQSKVVNYNTAEGGITDPLKQMYLYVRDGVGATTGQVSWQARGIWDGVS